MDVNVVSLDRTRILEVDVYRGSIKNAVYAPYRQLPINPAARIRRILFLRAKYTSLKLIISLSGVTLLSFVFIILFHLLNFLKPFNIFHIFFDSSIHTSKAILNLFTETFRLLEIIFCITPALTTFLEYSGSNSLKFSFAFYMCLFLNFKLPA